MTESLAATPRLDKDGTVALLNLGAGENRFNRESTDAINAVLDEVEAGSFTALVTSADGKIWSNGFDAPWIAAHPDEAEPTVRAGERLLARLLTFPMPTVAAVQGHAFAGGMLLALAHDLRVMRADRGFFCLPELTFGAVFTQGMVDMMLARMSPQVAHRAAVLAHRFPAPEAVAAGLVDEAVPAEQVLSRAVAVAADLAGADRAATAALKRRLYARPLESLGRPIPGDLLDALLALGARG